MALVFSRQERQSSGCSLRKRVSVEIPETSVKIGANPFIVDSTVNPVEVGQNVSLPFLQTPRPCRGLAASKPAHAPRVKAESFSPGAGSSSTPEEWPATSIVDMAVPGGLSRRRAFPDRRKNLPPEFSSGRSSSRGKWEGCLVL